MMKSILKTINFKIANTKVDKDFKINSTDLPTEYRDFWIISVIFQVVALNSTVTVKALNFTGYVLGLMQKSEKITRQVKSSIFYSHSRMQCDGWDNN